MRRGRKLLALPGVVFALFALLGCETTSEEDLKAAKTAEDWAAIGQAKDDLAAKRAELEELQQRIATPEEGAEGDEAEGGEAEGGEAEGGEAEGGEAEGGEAEGGEGEAEGGDAAAAPASPEELAAQAEDVQKEVYDLEDKLGGLLIAFINDQGISVGGELTEMQAGAIRMKSDLEIDLAKSYLDGGEYQRAIDIYIQAKSLDPDNEKLAAAIAHAEERRYMTEERLAEVKKGMTQDEVRELLGTPKANNVREFDQGYIGWFYQKEEPNTAAGVYFRKTKGVLKVYEINLEAVKAGDAGS